MKIHDPSFPNFVVFFLATLSVGISLRTDDCPPGWTDDRRKSRCIKAMDDEVVYDVSHQNCVNEGAELMKIENKYDQSMVECLIRGVTSKPWGYWIQLQRAVDNVWQFDNGDLASWYNWRADQPNDEMCVAIEVTSFKWHDMRCDGYTLTFRYICTMQTAHRNIVESYYMKEPSNCLTQHSILRKYNMVSTGRKLITNDCPRDCSLDTCCIAMATDKIECVLYVSDSAKTGIECVGETFKMFRKAWH